MSLQALPRRKRGDFRHPGTQPFLQAELSHVIGTLWKNLRVSLAKNPSTAMESSVVGFSVRSLEVSSALMQAATHYSFPITR